MYMAEFILITYGKILEDQPISYVASIEVSA